MIKEASKDITDIELDEIDGIVNELRQNYFDNRTKDIAFRMSMLKSVLRGIDEMEKDFSQALFQDLQLDEVGAYMMNILLFKMEVKDAIKHLSTWSRTSRCRTSSTN